MDNFKFFGIEYYGVIGSLCQVGQQFGMVGISVFGEMQCFFIQWCGSDGCDCVFQCQCGCLFDVVKCEIFCLGLDFVRVQFLWVVEWFINDVDGCWGEICFGGMVNNVQFCLWCDIQCQDLLQCLCVVYYYYWCVVQCFFGEGFDNNFWINFCWVVYCYCNYFRYLVFF